MKHAETGLLDANAQSFTVDVIPGFAVAVKLEIENTITITGTHGLNGLTPSAYTLPNGVPAEWTASESIVFDAPGKYTFTASGVSGGGTCNWATLVYRIV